MLKIRIPFSNRCIEIRSTLANPQSWLVEALGGGKAASGVTVNENTALKSTAVFACVRILAETVASLPLPVYRRLPGGGKERATDHYLYPLLHDQPNPEMTSFEFRETLMGHLALWGNAYAEIQRNGAGEVVALWPLRPDRMRVSRDDQGLQYKYTLPDGTTAVLRQRNIMHIRGLSGDGLVGYSPIRMAREAIGLALATEEFGARFFGQGSRPSGVLEHPGKLSKEAKENLRESWERMHSGLSGAHRIAILEEGMKWTQIGIPPEDAQFLETRKFQVTEIARIFRIPPHMLADLERATFSNIEHQSIEFVVHTIRPWLVRWEQAFKRDLFLPGEREIYFAEFLVDGLLRGDIESRYRAYATARQWGWMSANDVRELENMNPIPGGDVYLIPLNMVPAGSAGEAQRSIEHRMWLPDEERALRSANIRRGVANSYKKVISETVRRIIKREQADIMRAAEKYFGRRNVDTLLFDAWLQDFYREHEEFVESNMLPVLYALAEAINAAVADEIGTEPGITPELEEFIRDYVATYRSRHIGKSLTQIRAALEMAGPDYGDQLKVLQEEFDSWQDRPDETAQEEAVRAGNAVALMTYTLGGVSKVRWIATSKSCPYCQSLNGKVVGINTAFVKMGEELKPDGADRPLVPSRNVKHPPAHKGCDCMIVSGA
jgi:HK97 family phage portal protein